ncbi:UDP-N-acetyl-alpha-D-glucosamine C6 dehydratase [Sporomusa silvacetica DSM 10669]|uniref:UDP-N-acetyl-alpha-D-glucosamine C6 dehydratase n=1 Tax=Sporomusa silvacetica DSM 10669 TaxID=1123289 RepID=A0ABZ3IRQ1_9FIRM|nr:nucleoside-diphosphate sugar epimerase/dehydratase [Sporomusa silvacetica]OZC20549.1 UDP-N-acetyl-alpha-D-glucosamine C6 dehydratase [Sporomusa silvacetica DSM 10669]
MRQKVISLFLIMMDMVIVAAAPFIALFLRFEGAVEQNYYSLFLSFLPGIILLRLLTFYAFGLYHRLWRYASISELLAIISAVSISSLFITIYMYATGANIPRSIPFLNWIIVILLIGGSRLCIRVLHFIRTNNNRQDTRTLIVGAGDAGAMIAREIGQRYYDTKKLVGFIDDDTYKVKRSLFGATVLGNRQDIECIVNKYQVNEIIIAIPSLKGAELRAIVQVCKLTGCKVKTVPGIYELIDGKVTLQQLRDVDLEDLLRREPVNLDLDQIASYIRGKRVLVTGAGGSIGSELCRQLTKLEPSQLILLGKGENSIYEIDRELREKHGNLKLEPIIADVRDASRINQLFDRFRPQVVFHAAAHKHVPLMEAQPEEAVRNNVFGTKNVAEAACRTDTEMFIMISTDKAVNPTSVMGATKRVAELIVQSMNGKGRTRFSAVRFGNVLGSRGSVIPLFRRQIAKGGPITITHPEMKRYFMTIPEATQLVLQAGSMAQGGEVFVLDMGEPVKIVDMARDLIELSGLVPGKDVEIKYTGLRPGEKLFEELLTAEEGTSSTRHEKIYVANLKLVNEKRLQEALTVLQTGVHTGDKVVHIIEEIVPSYRLTRANVSREISRQKECNISFSAVECLTVTEG